LIFLTKIEQKQYRHFFDKYSTYVNSVENSDSDNTDSFSIHFNLLIHFTISFDFYISDNKSKSYLFVKVEGNLSTLNPDNDSSSDQSSVEISKSFNLELNSNAKKGEKSFELLTSKELEIFEFLTLKNPRLTYNIHNFNDLIAKKTKLYHTLKFVLLRESLLYL